MNMSKKEKVNKYIVASKDGKWFFTGKSYFSDRAEHAVVMSRTNAKELVSDITVMELELRKVA